MILEIKIATAETYKDPENHSLCMLFEDIKQGYLEKDSFLLVSVVILTETTGLEDCIREPRAILLHT